jgi:Peptidase family M28
MAVPIQGTKRKPNKHTNMFVIFLIFTFLFVLSFLQDSSPKPVSENAPAIEFSAERAMKHIREIAREPHPTGSEANEKVMTYIQSQLKELGVEPIIQKEMLSDYSSSIPGVNYSRYTDVYNIVGKLPGTNSTKAVMLTAHYDSVPNSPGANDDAAGVAALLETLRVLKEGPPLQNDIVFLITDGEEIGLLGARAYWYSEQSPFRDEIGLVVNFEARGTKGPSLMFQTSSENGWLIRHFAESVKYPVSSSMMGDMYALMPNDTDMTISNQAGISGVNFAFGDGWTGYHTMQDSIENVSLSTLQHHGVNALATAKQFGNADLSETKEADRVYFNLLGLLIHYPKSWVNLFTLVAIALFLYTAVMGIRLRVIKVGQLVLGFFGVIGGLIVSIVASYGLWYIAERLWGYKLQVFNGATYYHIWFELSFIFLTIGICFAIWGLMRSKVSTLNFWFAGQLIWTILLVVISIWLPGGSYLPLWPLIIQLIIVIIALHSKSSEQIIKHPIMLLFIAAGPIVLWTSIVRMIFVFMPIETNVYVIGVVALLLVILFPIIDVLREYSKRLWIIAAFSISIILLAGSYILSETDRDQPEDSNLFYIQDVDKQEARWVSLTAPNEWSSQYVNGGEWIPYYPLLFKVDEPDRLVLTNKAPVIPLDKPSISVMDSANKGDNKSIQLNVKSNRDARRMIVTIPDAVIEQVTLNGKKVEVDPTREGFTLLFTGKSPDGIELQVNLKQEGPTTVVVSDIKDDLAKVDGLNYQQRPSDLNPAREFDSTTIATTSFQIK